MKQNLLIPLFCFGFVGAMAVSGVARAATAEAAPVEALDSGLISAMKAGSAGASFSDRQKAISAVVAQSYDLPVVTKNSVGFLWSTLPAAQQQELITLIGQFTTTSYATQFTKFGGERFTVLPDERQLGTGYVVKTKLTPGGGGAPVELDYVVRNGTNGWRITDVLLGGSISQVALHESDFSSLVSSGDASRLIAALKAKIAKLQSGAAAQ